MRPEPQEELESLHRRLTSPEVRFFRFQMEEAFLRLSVAISPQEVEVALEKFTEAFDLFLFHLQGPS